MKYFTIIFFFTVTSNLLGQNQVTRQELDSLPYLIVDKEPEFPGGNDSLVRWISRSKKYPPLQRHEPQGTVIVRFVIEKNGKVSNVEIAKSFGQYGEYYDNEALRLIKSMPDWIPGQKDGKVVRTVKNLPVKFTIR